MFDVCFTYINTDHRPVVLCLCSARQLKHSTAKHIWLIMMLLVNYCGIKSGVRKSRVQHVAAHSIYSRYICYDRIVQCVCEIAIIISL